MAEIDETIISFVIFLFILLLFYLKFGKKIVVGEKFKKIKKGITDKLKIKSPKISLMWIIAIVIVAVFAGNYFYSNYIATTTYTFNSMNSLSSNWQINSGNNNLRVENGCLVITGPVDITIKGSENVDWTDIKITPCGQELNDITVGAGNLAFRYYFGPPPDTNYAWDIGSTYHVGTISTSTGTKVSVFFPSTGNLKRNNKERTLAIERKKIMLPNYKMSAVGSGTFDSITLADAYYSEDAGKGRISLITAKPQKIKSIEIAVGLLPRI